jgi:pantothenate kinase
MALGKTTLATVVAKRLNALATGAGGKTEVPPIATYLPMDGYHLSRAQLSAMPDPKHAHDRRGAAFTFDGDAFLVLLRKLKEPITGSTATIYAPSFDHAMKDPVNDDIPIPATSRIVVIEGNYTSLEKAPWREVGSLVDESWFVEVDFEVAGKRLVSRHVKAGLAADEASAWLRVRGNDLVNGREIVDFRGKVDEIVVSREDDAFK